NLGLAVEAGDTARDAGQDVPRNRAGVSCDLGGGNGVLAEATLLRTEKHDLVADGDRAVVGDVDHREVHRNGSGDRRSLAVDQDRAAVREVTRETVVVTH